MRQVLVVRAGRPHAPVEVRLGGFGDWLTAHLGAAPEPARPEAAP